MTDLDLARRACACLRWRWLDGAAGVSPADVCPGDPVVYRRVDDAWVAGGRIYPADGMPPLLPDPADPATLGCRRMGGCPVTRPRCPRHGVPLHDDGRCRACWEREHRRCASHGYPPHACPVCLAVGRPHYQETRQRRLRALLDSEVRP